jgi:hypothetical protein
VKTILYLLIPLLCAVSLDAQEIPYDKSVPSFSYIPFKEDGLITILLHDMKRISGRFVSFETDTVTILDDSGELLSVHNEDIAYCRLEYDKSRRARRYGMWGGVVGLFAGIPLGSYQVHKREDDESVSDSFIYISSTVGGAIVGGLIGTGIGLATIPGDVVYKIEQ